MNGWHLDLLADASVQVAATAHRLEIERREDEKLGDPSVN
jgi:hypothetical protein